MDIFKQLGEYFKPHFEDISRGRNNELSKVMNKKVDKVNDKKKVYELIDGTRSTQDIANILGKPINKVSGRFSELKRDGKIELCHYKGDFSVYKIIEQ